jgi:quinol monooxygenase YgiN
MSDSDLILVAEVHGLAGLATELHAMLTELAAASRQEPRCHGFRVLTAEEPGEFVLLEAWSDESALRAHYDTGHYRHYRDNIGPMLARPSDVVLHHVSRTTRALDPNPPDPGMLG